MRVIGIEAGWRQAKTINFSEYLSRAKGLAALTPKGWKLTENGIDYVDSKTPATKKYAQLQVTKVLRDHVAKLKNDATKEFVEEAIGCLENGLRRSAVVLAWVGAVSVLYDYVIANKLAAFNAAGLAKKQKKWTDVSSVDDLSELNDKVFLEVCYEGSVIGKSVKEELEGCLKLRNGCGHPNTLKIGDARVVTHIDQLILNVFQKF